MYSDGRSKGYEIRVSKKKFFVVKLQFIYAQHELTTRCSCNAKYIHIELNWTASFLNELDSLNTRRCLAIYMFTTAKVITVFDKKKWLSRLSTLRAQINNWKNYCVVFFANLPKTLCKSARISFQCYLFLDKHLVKSVYSE